MIIKSISARNVLKYSELKLDKIPTQGLIAISGPNESGKSTIGETLCFAFFGRSFSLAEDDLEKIIRWGEPDCSVEVAFEVDGVDYTLSRMLDRDGNHSARLARADSQDQSIARGVESVADTLFELLGYEFDEFIESFYLAQREINTPHPHSQAVKIMAGIEPFERVVDELEDEIALEDEKLYEIDGELNANKAELADLELEEGRLARLQTRQQDLAQAAQYSAQTYEDLTVAADRYIETVPKVDQAQSGRDSVRFFSSVFLILALIAGALWAILALGPGYQPDLAQQVKDLISAQIPVFQDKFIPWIGYVAAGLGVLTFFTWMSLSGKARRLKDLGQVGEQLAEQLAKAREIHDDLSPEEVPTVILDHPFEQKRPSEDSELAANVEDEAEGETEELALDELSLTERADQAVFAGFHSKVMAMEASVSQVRDFMERENHWLKGLNGRQTAALDQLKVELADEQERLRQAAHLDDVARSLQTKREAAEKRSQLREVALDLIDGTTNQLSSRFNRDLKDMVGRTLPLFTEARYEHLKIAEDLSVRVFSSEKRDFMDLDEISSGTQRQIMLAIRLALAEQLLSRAVKGHQFAFLDEPFAFFDESRTRASLRALAEFSQEVSQIFIVAQSFPSEQSEFALSLACDRTQQVLGQELAEPKAPQTAAAAQPETAENAKLEEATRADSTALTDAMEATPEETALADTEALAKTVVLDRSETMEKSK